MFSCVPSHVTLWDTCNWAHVSTVEWHLGKTSSYSKLSVDLQCHDCQTFNVNVPLACWIQERRTLTLPGLWDVVDGVSMIFGHVSNKLAPQQTDLVRVSHVWRHMQKTIWLKPEAGLPPCLTYSPLGHKPSAILNVYV